MPQAFVCSALSLVWLETFRWCSDNGRALRHLDRPDYCACRLTSCQNLVMRPFIYSLHHVKLHVQTDWSVTSRKCRNRKHASVCTPFCDRWQESVWASPDADRRSRPRPTSPGRGGQTESQTGVSGSAVSETTRDRQMAGW